MDRFNWNHPSVDYCSQIHQENNQYAYEPEVGQTSGGVSASGPSWLHPAPGQPQPYQAFNFPSRAEPSLGLDLEYLQRHPQPMVLEHIVENDAPLAPSNPQRSVEGWHGENLAAIKEQFLAGLEAFGRGATLKNCSSSLSFRNYIKSDGSMINRGIRLSKTFTAAEKAQLDRAIIARHGAKLFRIAEEDSVKERFLAGLDNYAQGARLVDCSATLKFNYYVTDDGHLHKAGKDLYKGLFPEDQERVSQALHRRSECCLYQAMAKAPVEERFLAGLDKYAQGVPLKYCSSTLNFKSYVTDNGLLHQPGKTLRKRLSAEDQARIDQALLCRRDNYTSRLLNKAPVEKRFLACLDKYERGLKLSKCAEDIHLGTYLTDDGRLLQGLGQGQSLYSRLSSDDQARVNRALTARRRIFTQRTSKDVDKFMTALEPYGKGLSLLTCGNQSGLKDKAVAYLTRKGGLTHKGELLIENLLPGQRINVLYAIEKRRQLLDPSAQVPESSWQLSEMLSPLPEMRGMAPTAMVDSIPAETMVDPIQTEAMWATAWQLTGQVMPGTWGIPTESAETPIPYYDTEAVGEDFRHQYGPCGLIAQSAPDRLISRGIEDHMLINIQGEVYRVQDMGSSSMGPTNENPYGKSFMLVPHSQVIC
jgi:hypothetical protein